MKIAIYPSLISADVLNLAEVVATLEPHCDGFHIDVMDGQFVPALTWGPLMVNALAKLAQKPLFVHLMVQHNEAMIEQLVLKPKSIIAFHIESADSIERCSMLIKNKNCIPCLAISPDTPLSKLTPWLSKFSCILLMSVVPGKSGQSFIPASLDRLKALRAQCLQENAACSIAMDGGITQDNIAALVADGASIFGIASAVFAHGDAVRSLHDLYKNAEKAT